MTAMTIAIIGAGLAGLAAARSLAEAGIDAVVFEKSRGLGGRVATRRSALGAIDHGAPLLHGLPDDLVAAAGDAVAVWRDGHVGVPGASSLPRALAEGLRIETEARVVALRGQAPGWRLALADGSERGPFRAVILAIPHPQAVGLLGAAAAAFPGLEAVTMEPGFTLMAWLETEVPGEGWHTLAPPLGYAIRNGDKPGRDPGERWAVHADTGWARAHLEDDLETVAAAMLDAFAAQVGAGSVRSAVAHRWRYARTGRPLGQPCLWDAERGIGLAGDWCLGPDAGHAVASGRAVAARVREACGAWAG
jgi:predicted NAD/FAD-dependent oxidoreductase